MPIISTDYEGTGQYSFATNGTNVVLKNNVVYNYTGGGAAFLMNEYYCHFLVAGMIYSEGTGINFSSYGAYLDIAATGLVFGGGGSGIEFTDGYGSVTINNFGSISGQGGIDAAGSAGYVDIYNYGIISSDREYIAAITTGAGDDRIVNTGTIMGSIYTGEGRDTIDTHLGVINGSLDGGAGADTYIVAAGQEVSETSYRQPGGKDDGSIDSVTSYGDFTLSQNIENLTLLGDGKIGRGNNENNLIYGNDNGNHLAGGLGIDQLLAGSGDDILRGGDGGDILSSQEGADNFYGGTGDDIIQPGLDRVRIDGGEGLDVAAFLFNDAALTVDLSLAKGQVKGGAAAFDVLVSIEGVWGSQFDDVMTGSAGANNLLGYLGNDTLNGGGGDDTIEGYQGADKLDGGDGIDTLSYNFDYTGVTVNLQTGTGSNGDAQGDTFANFENLRGGSQDDVLTGSAIANVIEGGDGKDTINGGGGKDTITGGAGDDTLTGGASADVFVFPDPLAYYGLPTTATFGKDTITDFQDGVDRISFVGAADVHSLADLTISQSGASTVVLVTGTTDQITLLNFSAANFTAADVIFG